MDASLPEPKTITSNEQLVNMEDGVSFYQVEIAATHHDEVENLRRFDAAWLKLRRQMFGSIADGRPVFGLVSVQAPTGD
jgi:uncharacterized protein